MADADDGPGIRKADAAIAATANATNRFSLTIRVSGRFPASRLKPIGEMDRAMAMQR